MKVLEIGCGVGMFSELFARYGVSLLCVDISPDLIGEARRRFEGKESDIAFIAAPFEECTAHGPFDAIIGSSVLHHLDCEKAFPKILELLKPGGVMSFCEPNYKNPQILLERTFRKFFPYVSPDETAFFAGVLRADLERCGFCEIAITPFDWLHPKSPQWLIPLVQKMGNILENTPLLRDFSGSLHITASRPYGG